MADRHNARRLADRAAEDERFAHRAAWRACREAHRRDRALPAAARP